MNVAPRAMTLEERGLWSRIEAHAFEDAGIALDLTRRLARNMGWPLATAREAVTEYRRFCFLAMASADGPMTPSEEVDEVWHLHLTYTRDYWDRWCGAALGCRLHHDPTEGGPAETARYRAQYAATLALYESYFGPPPEAFWPGTAKRFAAAPRYRQVDGDRVLVLPRPKLSRVPLLAGLVAFVRAVLLCVLGGGAASAREVGPATTANVLDWSGDAFLALFIVLLAATSAVAFWLDRLARTSGRRAAACDLDPVAIAYLAGGKSRAADTLLLEMAIAGSARIDNRQIWLGTDAPGKLDQMQPYSSLEPGPYPRSQLLNIFADSARVGAIRADLVARALFLDRRGEYAAAAATILPMMAVLCLGVAKLFVGLSRDRPVGFLIMVLVVGVIVAVGLAFRGGLMTREGEQLILDLRSRHARALRAPLAAELPLAFALLGTAALAGSDFAGYATQIAPTANGSSGCGSNGASGCGGGGDGGGGGGGGGCGGCSS